MKYRFENMKIVEVSNELNTFGNIEEQEGTAGGSSMMATVSGSGLAAMAKGGQSVPSAEDGESVPEPDPYRAGLEQMVQQMLDKFLGVVQQKLDEIPAMVQHMVVNASTQDRKRFVRQG